jgi:hypothetical protein
VKPILPRLHERRCELVHIGEQQHVVEAEALDPIEPPREVRAARREAALEEMVRIDRIPRALEPSRRGARRERLDRVERFEKRRPDLRSVVGIDPPAETAAVIGSIDRVDRATVDRADRDGPVVPGCTGPALRDSGRPRSPWRAGEANTSPTDPARAEYEPHPAARPASDRSGAAPKPAPRGAAAGGGAAQSRTAWANAMQG